MIPQIILPYVFHQLNYHELLQCSLVCKLWYQLTFDPLLAEQWKDINFQQKIKKLTKRYVEDSINVTNRIKKEEKMNWNEIFEKVLKRGRNHIKYLKLWSQFNPQQIHLVTNRHFTNNLILLDLRGTNFDIKFLFEIVHKATINQQQQQQQQIANDMMIQINNDKINFLNTEYNDLLTTQLESQKFYFENQMEDMKKVFNVQLQNLNEYYENINMEKCREINELNEKLKYESNQNQNLEKEKNQYYSLMNDLLKEKKNMEKKIERSENLKKEYQEEKLLTKVLLENQDKLKNLVDEKDKEINDLKEQVRDLMFYLDAKSKVENCEIKDEIQNGTIVLTDETTSSNGKKKKKSKNKKKK